MLATPFNDDASGEDMAKEEWTNDATIAFTYVGDHNPSSSSSFAFDSSFSSSSSSASYGRTRWHPSSPYKSEWGGVVKDTIPKAIDTILKSPSGRSTMIQSIDVNGLDGGSR